MPLTLMIEGDPLVLALSIHGKGGGAIVAIDACRDNMVASKGLEMTKVSILHVSCNIK